MRLVRGFIQRLEGGALGSVQARLGEDLRSLADGTATAVLACRRSVGGADPRGLGGRRPGGRRRAPGRTTGRAAREGASASSSASRRSGRTRSGSRWRTGRPPGCSVGRRPRSCPIEALSGGAIRAPWGWQATALGRSLASVEPAIARDGRVVFLVDSGGAEGLVAAALGGAGAGFRLVRARLEDGEEDVTGTIELVPARRRRAARPADPRQRPARRACPAAPATRTSCPGPACSSHRNASTAGRSRRRMRHGRSPTSPSRRSRPAASRPATSGCSARSSSGWIARASSGACSPSTAADAADDEPDDEAGRWAASRRRAPRPDRARATAGPAGAPQPAATRHRRPATASTRGAAPEPVASDKVDRLIELIRAELGRPDHRRLTEIEPGRWWLADREDIDAAAVPLADRVEWAVYSLLSTAGPLPESSFFERIAALFTGHDLPDEALVRACLQSYRSLASTPDRVVTGDDLLRRAQQHAEMIARLADGGHRLGMSVWIGRREQARKLGSRRLGDWLDEREQRAYLAHVSRAVDDLAGGRLRLVRPRPGGAPVRGRVDGDARRAAAPPPRPDPAGGLDRPVPRRRPGADGARPPQDRAVAADPRGDRARQLAHPQVEPPPGVPRPRRARTSATSSRTSGSTRSSSGRGEQLPLFEG